MSSKPQSQSARIAEPGVLGKEDKSWFNFSFFVVAASILAAVILILPNIGIRSFWLDEAAVANAVKVPFSGLLTRAINDSHPLVYIYVMKVWSLLFGDSEVAFRSFSALFALLLIPLAYSAGKFLFNSSRIGELAALLTSTNYFLIFYATQNRPYTLVAWLSLCSFFYFFRWLKEPNFSQATLYILFTVLGFFTHSWFFLIFGAEGIVFLVFLKSFKERLRMMAVLGLTGILSIPAAVIYWQQGKLGVNDWLGRVSFGVIFESLDNLSYGQTWNYVAITIIAVIVAMYVRSKRSRIAREENNSFINSSLLIYLMAPLIAALIISQLKPIYIAGRYDIIVLPAMLLLLAGWWRRLVNKKIVLIIIGFSLFCFSYYNVKEEQKLIASYTTSDRDTTHSILDRLQPNDKVVATGLSYSTFYYYSKDSNSKFHLYAFPLEINEHPGWIINSGDEQWQTKKKDEAKQLVDQLIKPPAGNVWIILSDRYEPNNYLLEALDKRFELAEHISAEEPHQTTSMNQVLLLKPKPVGRK